MAIASYVRYVPRTHDVIDNVTRSQSVLFFCKLLHLHQYFSLSVDEKLQTSEMHIAILVA